MGNSDVLVIGLTSHYRHLPYVSGGRTGGVSSWCQLVLGFRTFRCVAVPGVGS